MFPLVRKYRVCDCVCVGVSIVLESRRICGVLSCLVSPSLYCKVKFSLLVVTKCSMTCFLVRCTTLYIEVSSQVALYVLS